MAIYSEEISHVLDSLQSSSDQGLTEALVTERQEKYGENKLAEKKKKTKLQRFFEQFKDAMSIIVLIAAAISFTIGLSLIHI